MIHTARTCVIIIIIFVLSVLTTVNGVLCEERTIGFLETRPETGEGILQMLRRHGLPDHDEACRAFLSLNAVRMSDGASLKPDTAYTLPIIDIRFDEPFTSVLTKLGVSDFSDEIIQYNRTYNPQFRLENGAVPDGIRLLIPEPGCGYYKIEKKVSAVPTVATEESAVNDNEYAIPYPEVKKRFQAGKTSMKLKNYCFILDPGHGGDDPGTNPYVERGDGKAAHAFEAPLVYDTTLRLMKFIIENGGEVFITHYSTKYGIRDIKNPQDYFDQKYNLTTRDIKTDTPAQSLAARKEITASVIKNNYNKGRKVVFLSIHADYLPDKTRDLPITFFYHRITRTDGGKSKRFSDRMAKTLTGSTANSKPKGLGVLSGNPADFEILIELANLNNKNGAWRLRYHTYREKLAKTICDGLITVLPTL